MSSEEDEDRNLDYEPEGTGVREAHDAVKREKEEPRSGLEPAGILSIILAANILMLGASYLGAYSNGFEDTIYAFNNYEPEPRPAVEGADTGGEKGPWIDGWLADGKKVYNNCVACHQPSGGGVPGQFPPLTNSEWVDGGTERFGALMLHGITGPLTVAGATYNQAMPAWNMLGDDKLAQVITYVRHEFGGMTQADALVTEEMIGAARETFSDRTTPWTEAELLAIPVDKELPGSEVAIDLQTGKPAGEAAPAEGGETPADGAAGG